MTRLLTSPRLISSKGAFLSSGMARVRRFVPLVALGLVACSPLTREEAAEAVEEAKLFSQAATLFGNTVELNSEFTIGAAVEASAENLRDFVSAQLPCAKLTLEKATLTIEYGVNGECTHKGMTFTGTQVVIVEKATADAVVVKHTWTDLNNGTMEVDGTAEVTWNGGDDPSRRIVHDLSWKRLSDGRSASGTGDRLQKPLDGDLEVGFTDDGEATWKGTSGTWHLDIQDIEARWRDPVPQSGAYVLDTPFDKSLSLSFERTAATNVHLVASSGGRNYESDVTTVE